MTTTVAITGATGFIGRALHQRLAVDRCPVQALVRENSQNRVATHQSTKIVVGDLSDPSQLATLCAGADIIFHLAGLLAGTRRQLESVNRDGTRRLLEAAVAAEPPPRIILVSSIAAAGPRPLAPSATEAPAEPISDYGRSKRAGELVAGEFAGRLPITIARPGVVFGGEESEFRRFLLAIRRWRLIPKIGHCEPPISFVHIDDLVEGLVRLSANGESISAESANRGIGQGIFPIAARPAYRLSEVGRLLRPLLNRPYAPVIRLPVSLVWLLAAAAEQMPISETKKTFNRDKIREATASSWEADPSRIEALGWRPAENLEARFAALAASVVRPKGSA